MNAPMEGIILQGTAEQGSREWFADRAGRATASEFESVQMEGRSKNTPSETRLKYAVTLAMQRITGTVEEGGDFPATRHGKETEPYARMGYEAQTGNIVEEVGFIKHPTIMAGASPDALIDTDGGLEIKCPANPLVHWLTIKRGMPKEHIAQVQGGMWVTGRQWWDFVSYRPDAPEGLKLYVQRIQRDEAYIATLEAKVKQFLAEVDELEAFYRKHMIEERIAA
jgi:YqaJ-like viral recombinase domain